MKMEIQRKFILLVSALYPPEPVVSAHLSLDIYEEIKNGGHNIRVFHPKASRPNGFHFKNEIIVGEDEYVSESYVCPKSSLLGRFIESISFGKATYKFIIEHKNEISSIYANTWPLFGQYYLAKAAKKTGIPYYMHVQDVYPESYCSKMPNIIGKLLHYALLPIDKYVLRNASGVIGISPSMISYLSESRCIEKTKFTLVRNWQDDQSFIEAYTPKEEVLKVCEVMYLGSVNPTANVALIINSFSNLDASKYHLSIIGNGPDKDKCQALAEKVGANVTFGVATLEEVPTIQGSADILVLSLRRGVAKTATPSKLTAYMLTGRPIIVSVDLDSDCANIIREAGCGEVVEPDNMEALTKAIERISKLSIEEKNNFGKAAFDYAVAHLSKERNLSILTNLITKGNNDCSK